MSQSLAKRPKFCFRKLRHFLRRKMLLPKTTGKSYNPPTNRLFPSSSSSIIPAFLHYAGNKLKLHKKAIFIISICLTFLLLTCDRRTLGKLVDLILGEKTTNSPFVHLKWFGRLGNQLFEYSCAYALARKNGIPLVLWLPPELREDLNNDNVNLNPHGPYTDFALHFFNVSFLPAEEHDKFMRIYENNPRLIYEVTDEDISSGNYPVRIV
jgi:hypothetical protein